MQAYSQIMAYTVAVSLPNWTDRVTQPWRQRRQGARPIIGNTFAFLPIHSYAGTVRGTWVVFTDKGKGKGRDICRYKIKEDSESCLCSIEHVGCYGNSPSWMSTMSTVYHHIHIYMRQQSYILRSYVLQTVAVCSIRWLSYSCRRNSLDIGLL